MSTSTSNDDQKFLHDMREQMASCVEARDVGTLKATIGLLLKAGITSKEPNKSESLLALAAEFATKYRDLLESSKQEVPQVTGKINLVLSEKKIKQDGPSRGETIYCFTSQTPMSDNKLARVEINATKQAFCYDTKASSNITNKQVRKLMAKFFTYENLKDKPKVGAIYTINA